MSREEKNLNLLSTLHYVLGFLALAFSLLPLIYVFLGYQMLNRPRFSLDFGGDPHAPELAGQVMIGLGILGCLLGLAVAALTFVSAWHLGRRTGYLYCFIVACVECLFTPFGTALGVCTIVALSGDATKRLYGD